MARRLFTSESVSEGHPDKVSDQISDAVLDFCLVHDPDSRVAVETLCTTDFVCVAGEVTTRAPLTRTNIDALVRSVIRDIGYVDPSIGFAADSAQIDIRIHSQSPDIAQGVDAKSADGKDTAEQGAGDQGLMFGYANNETPELMPATIAYAHGLINKLTEIRKSGKLKYLRPDAKSQVTVEYDGDKIVRIHTVVISTQHDEKVAHSTIRKDMINKVIKEVIPAELLDKKTIYHINPTGKFVVGGPHGDTGLTGRKIIVDSYGGVGRHGGGAFSGKDPSKVDRSAAYAARYVAKNIVAAKLAKRVEVQLAYAIGFPEPVSILVDTFGTGKVPDAKLEAAVRSLFDLKPAGIVKMLDLKKPRYRATAAGGHFGRTEKTFTWEKTDKVAALKRAVAET
jgi:S-adenosylmethionine synthetase